MTHLEINTYTQLERQIEHWMAAVSRLEDLELFAATDAWAELEDYLSLRLKESLRGSVANLKQEIMLLRRLLMNAGTHQPLEKLAQRTVKVRVRYQKVETLLDFYIDAINTRANPHMASLLTSCDRMVIHSMKNILVALNKQTPPVLTYIGEGLGAAILKAGLRLWDGRTESPVASIKLARHNLYRPTALIHEAGHQVAHILGWNVELAEILSDELPQTIAPTWAGWASEVAADTFAFANTGYAAIAGLHDVVAHTPHSVFRFLDGDPHPISYIRVLLGIEMCRQFYGAGPWDGMEKAWQIRYPLSEADPSTQFLIRESIRVLPRIVSLCLRKQLRAFDQKTLVHFVNPDKVAPQVLLTMEEKHGKNLFNSTYWLENEPLRLLALIGYRIAVEPRQSSLLIRQQEEWMLRAGFRIKNADVIPLNFSTKRYQTI
ncbi:hypothetical protein SAMN05216302_10455 [Nitrosomonas aestuarii]|uniref:Uncharacterized protein n=1 Tax=Nitrosomonas aestuarii TaxID=52441 RepID=A0A1I4FZ75_9PROT|nr:hypothetical protein [Nitrosomonas aestuarii]SFL23188.1 hypothetical protein SAMN05216302_10455 [Nitrosomonas aestuarii]